MNIQTRQQDPLRDMLKFTINYTLPHQLNAHVLLHQVILRPFMDNETFYN